MEHLLGCFFLFEVQMFKVNIKNIRTSCEISSKLQTKAPQRRHLDRSGVFIVNFVHTFHTEHIWSYIFIVDFEHVNPAKNRLTLKIVLLMRTNTRGHTLPQAGFVSESLYENSGRHWTNNIIGTSHVVKLTTQKQQRKKN